MAGTYRYWRMQAQGNAFLILDARDGRPPPYREEVRALADKADDEGKPFDQLLILEPSEKANVFMRIFNSGDGGEVEACGNGACCVARLCLEEAGTLGDFSFRLETRASVLGVYSLAPSRRDIGKLEGVAVEVRYPRFDWKEIPLKKELKPIKPNTAEVNLDPPVIVNGKPLPPFCAVNVGNPHAVFFFDRESDMPDLGKVGEKLENHDIFPQRANISFVHVKQPLEVITKCRIWERGVGITESCGTAACAMVAAAMRTRRIGPTFVYVPSRRGKVMVMPIQEGQSKRLFLNACPEYDHETQSAHDVRHLNPLRVEIA